MIFPADKGATRRIWGIARLPKSWFHCVCAHMCACAETRGQKRTRQSRISIAPSRYGASCGAATIKAPVTHCSYRGQWACTGDSAWFWTRLLSIARIKRFAIRWPCHAYPINKWKLLMCWRRSDEIISPAARFDKSANFILMDRWWANIMWWRIIIYNVDMLLLLVYIF